MITVYTMAYNEEVLMQFMLDHYRSRFPNCKIIAYDNQSTDNTVDILSKNGCEIRQYISNNQIDDFKLRNHKNNCWKDAETDWVLVCDVDELLDINESDLKKEESLGNTIISSEGWNMVNMENNFDFPNIKYGFRASQYDKSYLFNRKFIKEINYVPGGHFSNPIGLVKKSTNAYKLYHYKYINPDYHVKRYKMTADRLSETNKTHGMGLYYIDTPEHIRESFEAERTRVVKVIP